MRAIMRTACGCEKEFEVAEPPPHFYNIAVLPALHRSIIDDPNEPIEPRIRRFEFAGFDYLIRQYNGEQRAVYLEVL